MNRLEKILNNIGKISLAGAIPIAIASQCEILDLKYGYIALGVGCSSFIGEWITHELINYRNQNNIH